MSATRLTTAGEARRQTESAPDLAYFRKHFPLTVENFGALHEREAWLRRVWEAETRWRAGADSDAREVVTRGAPPRGLEAEGDFDLVYAGGALAVLHASLMAARHGRRVLVLGEGGDAAGPRVWNVSAEDLEALGRAGLFTDEEIEAAVVNRRRAGYVKFHDAASRVKAEPLWVEGVLDVAVDAGRLLEVAAARIAARGGEGSAVLEGLRFVRAHVEAERVSVEAEDASGRRRLFAARLFVDASGADSAVARQLNGGRALAHVCPTVGTVARGFARGEGPDAVDFRVGEILVSTEDASDHRQLVWGGFAGAAPRDEFTACLFFYDSPDSPADKSLLGLFECYFERLPAYKRRGAQWRVRAPLFGYAAVRPRAGRRGSRVTADDRVLWLGEAAEPGSPLAFGGGGAQLRTLGATAHLLNLALAEGRTDARSLSEINSAGKRTAHAPGLAEFMRPTPRSAPSAVNETLNAVMAALHHLDARARREFFLDRMSPSTLKKIFSQTARLYPRIFARVREHLGARGTFWWLAALAEGFLHERRERASAARGETDDGSDRLV